MAHYLLAATPIPGHVLPMLRIGADLRRRGHDVCLLTGDRFRETTCAAGLRAAVLPPDAQPRPVSGARAGALPVLARRWLIGRAEMWSLFTAPLAQQHRALQAILDASRFDAVLVDLAFTGVLPMLLAERPRPPVLVCGVSPLTLSSVDTPPFGTGWAPRPGTNYAPMTWVVHHLMFRSTQKRLGRALHSVGSPTSPVFLTDWPLLADWLLQLTVPGFEYPRRDLPATVTFTGPVLPEASEPPGGIPDWWDELDGFRKVVHVTQGTWDNRDLGRLIGPTFRALAHRDDLVVVATTGGAPISTIRAPIPTNARISDHLPYPRLLPRVDAMVTNGGYGGVQHALSHGVPLVVAGDTADKPEVAARVAYTGAGIDLGTGEPSATAIAAAVDDVLTDDRYRHAAQRLRREMAASTALDTIAELVATIPARTR